MSNPNLPPPDWGAKPTASREDDGTVSVEVTGTISTEKLKEKSSRIGQRIKQIFAFWKRSK